MVFSRAALAANLDRAAVRLDSVATLGNIPETVGSSRKLNPTEAQALSDAGAALWDAVRLGALKVPRLARLAGRYASQGRAKPDTGGAPHVCQNFLCDAMRHYCYPMGSGAFPRFVSRSGEVAAEQKRWELHQIESEATGCRMFAEMVRFNAKPKHLKAGRAAALSALANAADGYVRFFDERDYWEASLFESVYALKCFYRRKLPPAIREAWRDFLDATKPYFERLDDAVVAAESLRLAVRGEVRSGENPPAAPDTKPDTEKKPRKSLPRNPKAVRVISALSDPKNKLTKAELVSKLADDERDAEAIDRAVRRYFNPKN